MLKSFFSMFIYAALMLCIALYMTGCAEASRAKLDGRNNDGGSYDVALKWTGDDGLSIAFKRAIRNAVNSSPLFRLSYYGNADIIIDNVSNVVPVFSKHNSINGFTYHIILHRGISSNKNMTDLGRINGKCRNDDIQRCAFHLLEVIQKRLAKK